MNSVQRQLKSMLQIEPRDGGFSATLTLDQNFSILPDHFAGQPILPGMCMVQAVVLAAAMNHDDGEWRIRRLKNAKLMAPVQPGDTMQIDATVSRADDGSFAVKAKLTRAEQKVAEISLIAVSATAPAAGMFGKTAQLGDRPHPNLLPEGEGTRGPSTNLRHLNTPGDNLSLPPGESGSEGERQSAPIAQQTFHATNGARP